MYRTALALLLLPSTALAQDTLTVRAGPFGLWGEAPTLVEEVRIGTLSGAPETTFGRVGAVVPHESGVIVVDELATALRRFDADGRYQGDVGRVGAGPGEFRQALGVKPHPDGLAIWDPGNARISVFDAEGAFLRAVPHSSGFFTLDPLQVDAAGRFYVLSLAAGAQLSAGRQTETVWVHLDEAGEVLDSIRVPNRSRRVGFVMHGPTGALRPFTAETVSAMSPDGYLVEGQTREYALHRPLTDGRTLRIELDYRHAVIKPQERAEWNALLEEAALRIPGARLSRVPSGRKPAFRELRVDQEGRIWVSLYVPAEFRPQGPVEEGRPKLEWREPPTWDVFESRGRYLGRIVLPESRWVAASGDGVWVVQRGEFDEQYVVRYRITPGDSR